MHMSNSFPSERGSHPTGLAPAMSEDWRPPQEKCRHEWSLFAAEKKDNTTKQHNTTTQHNSTLTHVVLVSLLTLFNRQKCFCPLTVNVYKCKLLFLYFFFFTFTQTNCNKLTLIQTLLRQNLTFAAGGFTPLVFAPCQEARASPFYTWHDPLCVHQQCHQIMQIHGDVPFNTTSI